MDKGRDSRKGILDELYTLTDRIEAIVHDELGKLQDYSMEILEESTKVAERAARAEKEFKTELQDAQKQLRYLPRLNEELAIMKTYLKKIPDLHTRHHYEQEVVALQTELLELYKTGKQILDYAPKISKIAQDYLRGESDSELEKLENLSKYFTSLSVRAEVRYKLLVKTLSHLANEIKKSYNKNSRHDKFALLAIIFTSVGIGSWVWVWKALQQQASISLAIAASPNFSFVNVLFSIIILAGLIYGFKRL